MLRAFRRRWQLATGLGILAALGAMSAAWFLIPQKGQVIAYVQVMRAPETMTAKAGAADAHEFLTFRQTTIETMKSKPLLTRAIRDPSISQLPIIKKQTDPVAWLQDQLGMKYPNDAELLQVTMSGEPDEIPQVVKIVDAVIAAYFKEVVEKGITDRSKKEAKLRDLLQQKTEELLRDMHDVERLQKSIGVLDQQAAATHAGLMQQQLGVVNNSLFSHTAQQGNLEVEIDKYKLDIELARDPSAREARAEEEMHKDEKLRKLEEQRSDLELSIAEAKTQIKNKDNPTLKRLLKSLAVVEEKVELRRDELLKRFSDSNEAIKIKEYEGKQRSTERHRDSVAQQIEELKNQKKELEEQLKTMTRDTAELDNKKQRVKALQHLVDELNSDLYKISVEKSAPPRVQKLDDAIPPGESSIKRKIGLVGFCGFAAFAMVGFVVAFFEFQARRISSSTQLSDGLGLRVVGALPSVTRPGRKALAAANGDLNRLLVESIDTVRTNLIHSAVSEPMRVVMITSASDREGKTTVASQLAASLARCGRRTLLVDGDLRRPSAHKLFELPLEPGVCEVLRGEAEVDDVIRPTRVAGLWMISAGQYDLESIQALSKEGVGEVFDVLRSRFDFVIVDSAPVLSIADASLMGQNVDAAILSVMREVSQAVKVHEASEQLRSVGVHVLGAVMNGERTEATYRAYAAHT
ncbi:MAG TPA: polysaccharide biosynthesis tyrosine autokinase [Pirellulales bacterium]|nr:polysaccharide biosynthesis tyrosine autokinase [Pirellulales bacterium]